MKKSESQVDQTNALINAGQEMALQVLMAEMQALSLVIPGVGHLPPVARAPQDDSAFDNFPV